MFTKYDKAIAAGLSALGTHWFLVPVAMNPMMLLAATALVPAFVVWLVPNKK